MKMKKFPTRKNIYKIGMVALLAVLLLTVVSFSAFAQEVPDSSTPEISETGSLPASSEEGLGAGNASGVDESTSLSEDSSVSTPPTVLEGGSSSTSSSIMPETFANTLIPVEDFAALKLAVQDIVDSGEPGVILIANDIDFTSTINIAASADITFIAESGLNFTSAGNQFHFTVKNTAENVALRFQNIVLEGNNVLGGITSAAPNLTVQGAVIQNVKGTTALYNTAASNLTLENSVLQNNTVSLGAVYGIGGNFTVNDTSIINNTGKGLAINAAAQPFVLTMANSTVEGNAFTGRVAAGLDIFGSNLTVNIASSSISKNVTTTSSPGGDAYIQGGGMRVTAPSASTSGSIAVTITDSNISENEIIGGDGGGNPTDWGGAGAFITSRDSIPRFTDTSVGAVSLTTNITRTTFNKNDQTVGTGYYKSGGSGIALFTDGQLNIFGSMFDGNGGDVSKNSGTIYLRVGASNGTNIHVQNDENGTPTIFQNNEAHIAGIYTNYYDYVHKYTNPVVGVLIEDAIFRNNKGTMGMALYMSESYPYNVAVHALKRCTIINNQSTGTYTGVSAAVVASFYNNTAGPGSTLLIEDSVFNENTGYSQGASVYFSGPSYSGYNTGLVVTGSTFTNNKITGTGALDKFGGAGIFITNPAYTLVTVSDTTFANNYAPQGRFTATNPYANRFSDIHSVTVPFTHPMNNYDINYTGGSAAIMRTVAFNSDGGTPVASIIALNGSTIQKPEDPTKEHYIFQGWYKDAATQQVWNFATAQVTGDITLYAKWELEQYTVQFDAGDGTAVSSQPNIDYGSYAQEPVAPTLEGHTLTGWYTEASLQTPWDFDNDAVEGDMTLFAKWKPHEYTVSFYSTGGTYVEPLQGVPHGSTITPPPSPTLRGYTFFGWYTDATLGTLWNFEKDTVTSSITLYAGWEQNLSTSSSSSASSSSSSGSSSAPSGTGTVPSSSQAPSAPTGNPGPGPGSTAGSSTGGNAGGGGTSASNSQNWEAQNEETLVTLTSGGVPTVTFGSNAVPLYGTTGAPSTWALVNLVLTIFSVLFSGFIGVPLLVKKRTDTPHQNDDTTGKRRIVLKIAAIVCGLALLVIFLLLQNVNSLMVIVNQWTVLFAGFAILQPILYLFSRNNHYATTSGFDDI